MAAKKPLKKANSIRTRANSEIFLVGQPLDRINGTQLPTKRQAIQYFYHIKNVALIEKKSIVNEYLAGEVVDTEVTFWKMARIKTMTRPNAVITFMKIVNKHMKLLKNKGRKSDAGDQRKAFQSDLDKLFDLGAKDVIEYIQNNRLLKEESKKEDIAFYNDQRTTRVAHMSGHDKIFEGKILNKMKRDTKFALRLQKERSVKANRYFSKREDQDIEEGQEAGEGLQGEESHVSEGHEAEDDQEDQVLETEEGHEDQGREAEKGHKDQGLEAEEAHEERKGHEAGEDLEEQDDLDALEHQEPLVSLTTWSDVEEMFENGSDTSFIGFDSDDGVGTGRVECDRGATVCMKCNDSDDDFKIPSVITSMPRRNTVPIALPKAIMESEDICATADRYKISDVGLTAIVAAVLRTGGADVSEFILSKSSTRRSRLINRHKISNIHMQEFMKNPPPDLLVHWDSKLIKDVLGSKDGEKIESLAVLVSGTPHFEEGKILII